jgi:hypothetical protein
VSAVPLERPLPRRHLQAVPNLAAGAAVAPPAVQLVLRTHRACAPEHAGLVRAACMRDRSVLPRWHQDDRGRANAHRGVHVAAPDGAYSAIPTWRSRNHWVTYVIPVAIALHRDVLIKHHVSPHMFREWAKVKSGYADPRTGRRCIVRPSTLARILGVDERHVQNINRAARELGLEQVVLVGRMLNAEECMGARMRGSRQRGLSTEVALTASLFLARAVDSFTPTSGRATTSKSHPSNSSLHGLAAEQKGSAPPTHLRERRIRLKAARRLASETAHAVPWLATERPARLAPALTRFANAAQPWTAQDIADAIATHSTRTGRGAIDPASIRTRPAALLAFILRDLDELADHPGLAHSFSPTPPAEPCSAAECDQGWLELEPGQVTPCPTCPPEIRRSPEADVDTEDREDSEDPPF